MLVRVDLWVVLKYLERMDPEAAKTARQRYGCFTRFGDQDMAYTQALQFGLSSVMWC